MESHKFRFVRDDSKIDRYKYCSTTDPIKELGRIERDTTLTTLDKCIEFELVAYSRTVFPYNARYRLIMPGDLILCSSNYREIVLYKPKDSKLPTIYLYFCLN